MIDPDIGAPAALPSALVRLGYDREFAAAFARVAEPGESPARVLAVHRNRIVVDTAEREHSALLDATLRDKESLDRPATGDWVVVHSDAPGMVDVRALLPRRTAFIRGAAGEKVAPQLVAANVDYVLIVTALPGDFNERRLERYLALSWESGAMPILVLTKCDLAADVSAFVTSARGVAPGVEVVTVSATSDDGVAHLQALVPPSATIALLGSSGVGKSTLVNRLAGETVMKTADVDVDGRGRHTTTHRELRLLANGMLVIDTPGMRELQLWSAGARRRVRASRVTRWPPVLNGRSCARRCGRCASCTARSRSSAAAETRERSTRSAMSKHHQPLHGSLAWDGNSDGRANELALAPR